MVHYCFGQIACSGFSLALAFWKSHRGQVSAVKIDHELEAKEKSFSVKIIET